MARPSEQMQYFFNKKITEVSNWRDVDVVFSEEGEHKIMKYIRLSRAQRDYNPNIRHCLYGIDANLIMLGLFSHDPHFCLAKGTQVWASLEEEWRECYVYIAFNLP